MATVETQVLDEIIVRSRRKLLSLGGAALAGLVVGSSTEKAYAAAYTDADILNFALNLEYLEANFYYMAAFGTTIDKASAASTAAGAAVIPITGYTGTTSTAGGTAITTGAAQVPFGTSAMGVAIQAYANETAVEEGKHVLFLQKALSTAAVAQPMIDIGVGTGHAFGTLGGALTPSTPGFTPYDSATDFLLGAYVFEDVGVTAYHGAASLLTVSANLSAAAAILGVEAYHAGLIRTTITALDAANGNTAISTLATAISTLRATLSKAALLGVTPAASAYDPQPDDYGTTPTAAYSLDTPTTSSSLAVSGDRIIDADPTYTIAFARNTSQVLNIVTGGGAAATGATAITSPAKGVFFPVGMNAGTANGFR